MAKGVNQKLKLLYLMDILLEKTDENHGITMNEIISSLESYDVSAERKSIYRDIEELQRYGLDVLSYNNGRATYYHVASRLFEIAELKLLVDAVQSSKYITEKKSRDQETGKFCQQVSGTGSAASGVCAGACENDE